MTRMQESGEMYLETILVLQQKSGAVRSLDIANHRGVSKPSVSRAVGLLRDSGHILVDREGYITLTEKGEALARKIYERHTVLSAFLIGLGVEPETAAEDACRMEHVISDASFAAIQAYVASARKD